MKRAFLMSLIAGALVLWPTLVHASSFTDIEGAFYENEINYLEEKAIIQGYNGGQFRPEQATTRAEFLKMLFANYRFSPDEVTIFNYPYTDVPEDSWFAPYVQRGWEIGILENKSELHPHETLKRIEGAKLMLNLLGIPIPRIIHEEEWPLEYRDVRSDMWYAPTVLYATSYGLIDPYNPDDIEYFRPLKPLTRGESAKLLYNMDAFLYGSEILTNYADLEEQVFGSFGEDAVQYEIPHLDLFVDVWNRLHTDYYHSEDIDAEQLVYEALKGMIDELDDPYSVFFDPPEASDYHDYLEGELSGIGAQVTETDEGVIIQAFITGGPAESSGLRVNDLITQVDGVDVQSMGLQDVINLIRGETDTDVTLTVTREGVNGTLEFTITRAIIDIGYLAGELIGDAIYIDINLFDSLSFIDFTQTVTALMEENPNANGFIIDVRGNPGGYLESAKSVIGHFIPSGEAILFMNYGPNHGEIHLSTGKGEWADYPIVILIDEGSASAAEIVAMVLKEKKDAVLVGKTTFGKGTVQEIIYYLDGSSLKLTIAEWRSSKFHSIDGMGLSPHYDVDLTHENILAGEDPQLEEAIEALQIEIEERAEDRAATDESSS